jgi:hypothetical protein
MDLRLSAVLLVLAVAPGQDRAGSPMVGFLDAATLSQACSAGATAVDARSICLGYISGAADQLLAAQALRGPAGRRICIPTGVTAAEVMAEVGGYATWTHNAKGISAAGFVEAALERAYPCDTDMEPM